MGIWEPPSSYKIPPPPVCYEQMAPDGADRHTDIHDSMTESAQWDRFSENKVSLDKTRWGSPVNYRPSTDKSPPIGKTRKIAVTLEPVMQF